MTRIKRDEQEFLDILRGKLRKDLLGYIQRGQITILGPNRGIAIPVESIKIPRLHFAPIPEDAETGEGDGEVGPDIGVGQGPGEPGTDLGPVYAENGEGGEGEEGERTAGLGRGPDIIEVEIPAQEFYELFKEVLELPRIKPKGEKYIKSEERKYTDIRRVGPESLIHKKRTLKEALKRQITEGKYDPENPRIIPIREDKRYRIPDVVTKPKNNAVIFFMMDVSGSMTSEDRRVVRYFCALCEFWLAWNYEGLETVWIIHDGEADRVSKEVFFRTQRGGGTVASSAHQLMLKIIEEEYPASLWNIYPIYLSDGFNWSDDDDVCLNLLEEKILPIVNQYTYCEVSAERYWWQDYGPATSSGGGFSPQGNFGAMLRDHFKDNELVVATNLKKTEEVPDAIKAVFGKGN